MKKADIRTTATLNIHEKRMLELMDAPAFMAKTDASAAAYKEIKDGAWKKEIADEARRLDLRINKKGATDMTKKIETTTNQNIPGIVVERQKAEIAGLTKLVGQKDAELDRLLALNNAGAEEVYGLKKEILRLTDQVGDQGIKILAQAEEIKAKKIQIDELITRANREEGEATADIETLKGYLRVAEEKIDEIRNDNRDKLEEKAIEIEGLEIDLRIAKATIKDLRNICETLRAKTTREGLKNLTDEEFNKLKVKVSEESIRRVKADYAARGIEIEW